MKRAVIFYNGNYSDFSQAKEYIKDTDYIICADGGTKHALKLHLMPNVIIGDLDSLDQETQKKLSKKAIEWITFPKEKDETDSELVLKFAVEKGFKELIIFGFFGSRLDHMLTNIFALAYLLKHTIDVKFIEGKQEIHLIDKEIFILGEKDNLVSLLPLQGDVKGVTTTNLSYPLKNETLFFGYSRGISNVMTERTAKITIKEGKLLVIHTRI